MPLTPRDVAEKQFRRNFRGYDVDQVDAFLDEVEAEIKRLMTAAATAPSSRPAAEAAPAPAGPAPAGPATATAPPVDEPRLATLEGQEAALRTLLLAQRTADEAIAEARAEADQILTAARDEAAATLTAAREEAGAALTAAREEAEGTLTRSREDAARADRELAERRSAALDDLERQRGRLEADVEELRAFEREYRTRLRAYLEGQLRDLDGGGGSDEIGVGVPVGAGGAAVGRPEGGAVRITGPAVVAPAVPLHAVPAAADPGPDPAASTAEG